MEKSWNTSYHGIGVTCSPKVVRALCDDNMTAFLKTEGRAGAVKLAGYIKEKYRRDTGSELKISRKSLACEIYWHHYVLTKCRKIESRFGRKRFTQWLIRHTEVTDCGEKDVDNNRLLWDVLSILPFT